MKIRARGTGPQVQLVNSTARFPAMVAGFGAGKTQALMMRTLSLIFGDGQDIAYYLPSYPLVRTIAYPRFSEMFESLGIECTVNKSEHTIQVNGKTIIFRTMDNPDSIVGYEVGDSMVDELDTLPMDKARNAWNKIIARNRQKKRAGINTVAVGTTPEGFRFVYDRWSKNHTESYELIRASTYSNQKNLPDGYIESLRETYPANLLQAYLEGEFVNLTSGVVYPNYDRVLSNTDAVAKDHEPLHIGMDFNVNNMAAAIHVMRDGKGYVVDEIIGAADTPSVIAIIRERYPSNSVIVYPDASGAATSSTNASLSDIKMLKNAGFSINAPRKNGRIRDRVSAVNKSLCDPKGVRVYYVNAERCPNIALGLEQQAYDTNGAPDKSGGFDHMNDATGYFVVRQFPIQFNRIITAPKRWS